jgi:hypothetical protein
MSGKRLNTEGSVSISVETARSVRGQRIITAAMASPPITPSDRPGPGPLLAAAGVTLVTATGAESLNLRMLWISIWDFPD